MEIFVAMLRIHVTSFPPRTYTYTLLFTHTRAHTHTHTHTHTHKASSCAAAHPTYFISYSHLHIHPFDLFCSLKRTHANSSHAQTARGCTNAHPP